MNLKVFTISDIRSWSPCYDPTRHLQEDWTGTVVDWLKHPTIPEHDKIWLLRRYSVMTAKGLRLFAVDCARRAQTYPKNYTPDSRTLAAIQAAEDFANDLIGASVLEEFRKGAQAAAAAYSATAAAAAAASTADAATAAAYAADAVYDAAADAADADAQKQERQAQFSYLLRMVVENPEHFILGE